MKFKLREIFSQNQIKEISFDSRNVKPNYAFFAIKGEKFDGNEYIGTVFEKGASIVFTDNPSKQGNKIIYVEDIRDTLALAASILYPKTPKNIIAVTGTNGKSSVVSYVHQILSLLGEKSAMIGTLGLESTEKLPADYSNKNTNLTTPNPIIFRKNLQILSEIGVKNVAFEASSHGLQQKRIGDVKVTTAAFTSFSQDHLEYHKTMESYLNAKLSLFTDNLLPNAEAVINSDIMFFDSIQKFLIKRNISYSTVGLNGDLKITKCEQSITGQKITYEFMGSNYAFQTDIIGSFQASNLLIAVKLVHNLGIDLSLITEILPKIKSVTGRLQRITGIDSDFQIFVDYAHTPDALRKSLVELQKIKKKSGNLYVIFGCGGDRDSLKRPIMGKIAAKNADYVVVTDDNPRTENATKIRAEIARGICVEDTCGVKQFEEIADRKKAIINTIARLKKSDILLIAGKGHENYQIIGNKTIEFSDIKIVNSVL